MFGPMVRRLSAHAGILALLLISLTTWAPAAADGPLVSGPQSDARWGGVLDESYDYHRAEKGVRNLLPERPQGCYAQKVPDPFFGAPAHGAYGYGFPVHTYRWGWFGAEHYYPWVLWHRGYNGDSVRWAYRRGY